MTVTEIRDKGRYRRSVTIDYDKTITLSEKDVYRFGLKEGEEIPEESWEELLKELCSDCITKCGKLLKDQDYSEKGLKDKLLRAGYPEEAADYAVMKMVEAHYVDDRRYAESYIRYHLEDRSLQRIRMDLKQKGIPDDIAEEAVRGYEEERGSDTIAGREIRQAKKLLLKRHFDPANASFEEIQKQTSFLYRKGYMTDVIKKAMEEMMEGDS